MNVAALNNFSIVIAEPYYLFEIKPRLWIEDTSCMTCRVKMYVSLLGLRRISHFCVVLTQKPE